jgi:hypothetical protein
MNKRKSLHQKINELQKQVKELELQEQQKVGSLVIGFYEKNEIKDEALRICRLTL